MTVAAASLANLKSFQPGNRTPRRSADVDRALRGVRKLSPKAVEYCQRVLEDENEETVHRLKVAIAILDKVLPDAGAEALRNLDGDRFAGIVLHLIRDERQAEPPRLDVRTLTLGTGND
jgi:hypothetical protein